MNDRTSNKIHNRFSTSHNLKDCLIINSIFSGTHFVARGKRKRFMYPVMVAVMMVKAIMVPLVIKFMAVMTGLSVLLSLLSLLVSSIHGFTKHVLHHVHPPYRVFHPAVGHHGADVPGGHEEHIYDAHEELNNGETLGVFHGDVGFHHEDTKYHYEDIEPSNFVVGDDGFAEHDTY